MRTFLLSLAVLSSLTLNARTVSAREDSLGASIGIAISHYGFLKTKADLCHLPFADGFKMQLLSELAQSPRVNILAVERQMDTEAALARGRSVQECIPDDMNFWLDAYLKEIGQISDLIRTEGNTSD